MLAATLRRLEQDGLIERRVYADVPVRVEYDLSPAARSSSPPSRRSRAGASAPPRRLIQVRNLVAVTLRSVRPMPWPPPPVFEAAVSPARVGKPAKVDLAIEGNPPTPAS